MNKPGFGYLRLDKHKTEDGIRKCVTERYVRDAWKVKPTYNEYAKGHGKASDCISCRRSEGHCPQNIRISEHMNDIAEKLG